MPYKTRYGSHYHITYGCHGATESCSSTEGLEPCSDCCGAGGGSGSGEYFTGVGSAGAGSAQTRGQEMYEKLVEHDAIRYEKIAEDENLHDAFAEVMRDYSYKAYEPNLPVDGILIGDTGEATLSDMDLNPDYFEQIAIKNTLDNMRDGRTVEERMGLVSDRGVFRGTTLVEEGKGLYGGPLRTQFIVPASREPNKVGTSLAQDVYDYQSRLSTGGDPARVFRADPQISAAIDLAEPRGIQAAFEHANRVIAEGISKSKAAPIIQNIGNELREQVGRLRLMMETAARNRRYAKLERKIASAYGLDATPAVFENIRRKSAYQQEKQTEKAAYAILEKLNASGARRPDGKPYEFSDVVLNGIQRVCGASYQHYGISDESQLNLETATTLANAICNDLEEAGYLDKITPKVISKARQTMGLGENESTAMIMALEMGRQRREFYEKSRSRANDAYARYDVAHVKPGQSTYEVEQPVQPKTNQRRTARGRQRHMLGTIEVPKPTVRRDIDIVAELERERRERRKRRGGDDLIPSHLEPAT